MTKILQRTNQGLMKFQNGFERDRMEDYEGANKDSKGSSKDLVRI